MILAWVEWVFSGVGVAVVVAVVGFFIRRFRKSPTDDLAHAELQQRQHASRPVFIWGHGNTPDFVTLTWQFRNEGGAVSLLSVESAEAVPATITPHDALPSLHEGFVRLSSRAGRLQFPIQFTIYYTTALNRRESQAFRVRSLEVQPEAVI